MADIPGLIKGASQGLGLGHDFLRHISRTSSILHVIEANIDPKICFENYSMRGAGKGILRKVFPNL